MRKLRIAIRDEGAIQVQPQIVRDPDDDQVLACALAAQADLIVTGDTDLLELSAYQNIQIVTAAEALRRIA